MFFYIPTYAHAEPNNNGNECHADWTKTVVPDLQKNGFEFERDLSGKDKQNVIDVMQKLSQGASPKKIDHIYVVVLQDEIFYLQFVDDKNCWVGMVGPIDEKTLNKFLKGLGPGEQDS